MQLVEKDTRDMRASTHLRESFRWSAQGEVELVEVLASAIGMATVIVGAAAIGHVSLGLAASVGTLAVGGVAAGSSAKEQARGLASASASAAAAAFAAALVAGHGWLTDVSLTLLTVVAATIGGYSRGLAIATIGFILFLTITINMADTVNEPDGLLILVLAGAIWTSILSLLFGGLARANRRADVSLDTVAPTVTAVQKYARWRRTLKHLSGWRFTLNLGLCMGLAGVLRSIWPDHHLHWIALTVALLTQRQMQFFPIKATQRALGTAVGVVAASLFIAFRPASWGLALIIGLLAGARPLLKTRSYLAYSVVMTPLIILIMNAGQPLAIGVLTDRLIATVVGALLVIAVNAILDATITTTMSFKSRAAS